MDTEASRLCFMGRDGGLLEKENLSPAVALEFVPVQHWRVRGIPVGLPDGEEWGHACIRVESLCESIENNNSYGEDREDR
mmetsp:Transcript_7236/g.14877  ORF Transcript_7236/g.14877 Transcript_7236/m.14877 type:complete len:80 (-) Transcript_7236:341-580(-)